MLKVGKFGRGTPIILVVVALASCGVHEDDLTQLRPDVPLQPAQPLSTASLAHLNGQDLSVGDFTNYVSRARGAGYRPATTIEAGRLLRAFLREILLDQQVIERGLPLDRSGRQETLAALIKQVAGTHAASSQLESPGQRRRAEAQRTAVLDRLLDQSSVAVERTRLAELVTPLGRGATSWSHPLPPGFATVGDEGT